MATTTNFSHDPSLSALSLPTDILEQLKLARSAPGQIQMIGERLEKAMSDLRRSRQFTLELMKERKKGTGSLPAELYDVQRRSTEFLRLYGQSHTSLINELDAACPLNRAVDNLWANQDARFARWQDDDTKLGHRIIHAMHYREGVDASKIEGPRFRETVSWLETLLHNPTSDERLGTSFGDLMTMNRENYRKWDLMVVMPVYLHPGGMSPKEKRNYLKENRKNVIGLVVLDGGTVEPIITTLYKYVDKESKNANWRADVDAKVVEDGKRLLAREFDNPESALYGAGDESDIDEAGWVQRSPDGSLRRIFTRDELIVHQRFKTANQLHRGWGQSPLQQSMFVLNNWLQDIFYAKSQVEPGVNHLKHILQLVGTAPTDAMVQDIWQQLEERVAGAENYGVMPILKVPTGHELKKMDFDPQAKYFQMLMDSMNTWISLYCAIHGCVPRDLNLPSAARAQEGGSLSGNDAGFEQAMARNEGLWGRLSDTHEAFFNKIVKWLAGPEFRFEFTGIRQLESEEKRIQNQNNKKWQGFRADQQAWGMDELPEDIRIFNINKKKIDIGLIPKEVLAQYTTFLSMEQQEIMQQQAMEQQAAQSAWDQSMGGAMGEDEARPGQDGGQNAGQEGDQTQAPQAPEGGQFEGRNAGQVEEQEPIRKAVEPSATPNRIIVTFRRLMNR